MVYCARAPAAGSAPLAGATLPGGAGLQEVDERGAEREHGRVLGLERHQAEGLADRTVFAAFQIFHEQAMAATPPGRRSIGRASSLVIHVQ